MALALPRPPPASPAAATMTPSRTTGGVVRLTRVRGRDGEHGVAAMRSRHQLDPRGWENGREVLARVVLDVGQAAGGGLRPVRSEEPRRGRHGRLDVSQGGQETFAVDVLVNVHHHYHIPGAGQRYFGRDGDGEIVARELRSEPKHGRLRDLVPK